MKRHTFARLKRFLIPSMFLLQAGGCNFQDFLNTTFLAITAAGSIAILDNV